MSTIIDSFILLILCAVRYPADRLSTFHIMCILLILALYCFECIAENNTILNRIGFLTLTLCFFVPELTVWIPFYIYIFFYRKQFLLPCLFVLPLIPCFYRHESYVNLSVLLLAGLSYYLAYTNQQRAQLQHTVHTLRDNSAEQQIILRKANAQLTENQNNQIYIATLRERNRIAREIHDNVGHMLSRSLLQVGALLATCRDSDMQPHLDSLKTTLDDAMNSIRSSVHDLHDESIDLCTTLEGLTEGFTFCPVRLIYDASTYIPKEIKYCFLSITREALNNVTRHSNATLVSVTVKEHPAFYQLLIEDNGTCSLPGKTTGRAGGSSNSVINSGIGLSNMRDRVEALHGILHITAENGYRIFVSIKK